MRKCEGKKVISNRSIFNWCLGALVMAFVFPASARDFTLSPGRAAYEKKDYEKAEEYFGSKALKSAEDVDNVYSWGNSLYQQGKYEEAEKAYQQALQKKPA